jgi:phosphoglycolate phosphatase-like HAD superfamily hydrolase
MRLVMFDVDGTLVESAVDTRCFLRAFVEVCGFADVDPDWSRYQKATDAGIFSEVFEARRGRAPMANETAEFREHLNELFRSAARGSPFPPIPGAADMLARLSESEDFRVAIGTGCWRESARIKMASAGMNYDLYPSASADDADARESILRIAVERARLHYGCLTDAIYVGDGVWDARACHALGIPFIGIGAAAYAEKLRGEGAVAVFADFHDSDRFYQSLQSIEAKR